jgi:hypothetical protein
VSESLGGVEYGATVEVEGDTIVAAREERIGGGRLPPLLLVVVVIVVVGDASDVVDDRAGEELEAIEAPAVVRESEVERTMAAVDRCIGERAVIARPVRITLREPSLLSLALGLCVARDGIQACDHERCSSADCEGGMVDVGDDDALPADDSEDIECNTTDAGTDEATAKVLGVRRGESRACADMTAVVGLNVTH